MNLSGARVYIQEKIIKFINRNIMPWSSKFHASVQVGDFHYTFTPNDLVNT